MDPETQNFDAMLKRIEARAMDLAHEVDRLREINVELLAALKLTLETAQRFEKQASRGTGGRRGGPVFTKARAAIARAEADQ